MYHIETLKMSDNVERFFAEARTPVPMGPGFSDNEIMRAETMRVSGSNFDEPEDYCVFTLFDKDGVQIAQRKTLGY